VKTIQQPAITGYRQLNAREAELMNKVKALGPLIQAVVDEVQEHIADQRAAAIGPSEDSPANPNELARIEGAEPQLWLNWGRDSSRAALMYLTRAIAQPSGF
jgi:hypothetical protein